MHESILTSLSNIFDLDPSSDHYQEEVIAIKKIIWKVISGLDTVSAADFLSSANLNDYEKKLVPDNFQVQLFLLLITYPQFELIETIQFLGNSNDDSTNLNA